MQFNKRELERMFHQANISVDVQYECLGDTPEDTILLNLLILDLKIRYKLSNILEIKT